MTKEILTPAPVALFCCLPGRVSVVVKLTEFRQDRWGHDRVQEESNRRLIRARKLFASSLRFIPNDLIGRRHIADYKDQHLSARTAERCLQHATEMVATIAGSIGRAMKTQITLAADAKTLNALARFFRRVRKSSALSRLFHPKPFVARTMWSMWRRGIRTEEDTFLVGTGWLRLVLISWRKRSAGRSRSVRS